MVESIVQLQCEVQNGLKRTGHLAMCLSIDELDFLSQLVDFLKPFKNFTDLFSFTMPRLSIIPMMKLKIQRFCSTNTRYHPMITSIKRAVLANFDRRLPTTATVQLHQLLDSATKDLLSRNEGTKILEEAVKAATEHVS